MAYKMADTAPEDPMSRRDYKTGSIYQRASDGRWFGSIEAGFTASGTRRRITVSHAKKSVVVRRLRDKRAELEREGRASVRRTITVARWATLWLDDIETKVRPSSFDTDRAALRYVVATIGHVKIADLTPADVRSVAAAIRAAGHSSSTALRYHGSLMRMLKAAALDGYNVPPNVLLAENPKKAVNDRQAIPLEDTLRILRHLTSRENGEPVVSDSSRWSLAFLQGIRQAEALGLTWEQVDLDAGTLIVSWQLKSLKYREKGNPAAGFRVPDGFEARHMVGATHLVRPKSAAGWRVMPLVPWAVAALRDWQALAPANPHGLVWPGRRTRAGHWPRNKASDVDQWEAIQAAVGVAHPAGRPYGTHEIRHTTATLLMELKVPESVRIAIMGHSSIASTRGYEFADTAQTRAALEQLGARLQLD
jgi:integrase